MKKIIVLSIALLFASASVFSQGNWYMKKTFGGAARFAPFGFSIGAKGYIATGIGAAVIIDLWEWDQATDVWTQKAAPPKGLAGASGFVIGTKAYMGTGFNGTADDKVFYSWDQTTNTWTSLSDYGSAMEQGIGFAIGNKGYIGGGLISPAAQKTFWEYDPATDTWTQKADIGGSARYSAVGFSIGSKGYAGTGNDGVLYLSDFWEYDPIANSWSKKADFPSMGRTSASGFVIGSKGYLGSGRDGTFPYWDWYEYDPSSDTWTRMRNFKGGIRFWGASFAIGNIGYLGTGRFNTGPTDYINDFWEFNPLAPGILIPPLDTTACAGGTITLTVQGYGVGAQYKWQKDKVDISTFSNDTFLVINPTTGASYGNYRCIVKNAYGSDTSTSALLNISSGTPSISLQPKPEMVCVNNPVFINIKVESKSTVYYQWYKNGKMIAGAIDSFLNIASLKAADTGYYVCYATNVCGLKISDSVKVTFSPPPATPTITQAWSQLTCSPAKAYQWKMYNADIPGATYQTLIITKIAKYSVEITDNYGCKKLSPEFTFKPSSVGEFQLGNGVNIYPIPNNGSFIVELNSNDLVNFKIHNSLGELVYEELNVDGSNLRKSINLGDVKDGIYFVFITGKELNYSGRIFIQK